MAIKSGRTCWHQACALQMMRGIQTCSAADVARELDIHWVVHRIVWDQLDYREVCVNWVPKNPTVDDKTHCMGLVSIGHVTLIKEGSSGAETWLITQIQKPEEGCVIENLSAPSSKENENIVISKDDRGKPSWDHKHVLVLEFVEHGDTVG